MFVANQKFHPSHHLVCMHFFNVFKNSMCTRIFGLFARSKNPFGKEIEYLIAHKLCDERGIPLVIKDCVDHLRQDVTIPGILLTPAPYKLVQKAYRRIKQGKSPKYDQLNNPHVACDILKIFLKAMPTPLISTNTMAFNRSFLTKFFGRSPSQQSRSGDEIFQQMERIALEFLHTLPIFHRNCLIYLLQFYASVHVEAKNGVDARNITPAIMPMLTNRRRSEICIIDGGIVIIEFLIENLCVSHSF